MASDAIDIEWGGGDTLQGAPENAQEYVSKAESVESSTFRELLGVLSSRLKLNELARELFWFGEEHNVTLSVEWVPREQNTLDDELSKLIIPHDWMLARSFFRWLEERWGTHAVDLFASDANN